MVDHDVKPGHLNHCQVCGSHDLELVIDVGHQPLCDALLTKAQLQGPETSYPLRLFRCVHCTLTQLDYVVDGSVVYPPDYPYRSGITKELEVYQRVFADGVIERCGIAEGSLCVDIGSNDGTLLKAYATSGLKRIGIDPTAQPRVESIGEHQVTYIRDLYTEKYDYLDVDFVCCRHALDQMPFPKAMVELIRRNLGARADVPVYFEVPNATSIFEDMLIRNIMYEKSSWFTRHSLARMCELCGFRVLAIEPCFAGGQYLGADIMPASGPGSVPQTDLAPVALFAQSIKSFAANHERKIQRWSSRLQALVQSGRRIIAWGSGAGGIYFFSRLGIGDEIPYVVDINPRRNGRFLPVTGQKVVAADFLYEYRPDVVIITNETFEDEIKQQVAAMGLTCSFWTV